MQTDRSLALYIVLAIVTCGIYGIYFQYKLYTDAQRVAGEQPTSAVSFVLLSLVTCGLYSLYTQYRTAEMLYGAGQRYGVQVTENGTSILLWCLVGSLLCGLGPLVGMSILIRNMNAVGNAYNARIAR